MHGDQSTVMVTRSILVHVYIHYEEKKNTSILKSMIIVGGGRKQLAVYDVLICETLAINIPSLALSVVDLLDL